MKKVITYGTFDLFHYGHLRLLKRAKSMGDYLIVAVSTDEFNFIKNKRCTYPCFERMEIVKAIKYVDEVIAEDCWDQKIEDVKRYGVDLFVMGSDWEGKFDFLKEYCEVVYLDRTPDISSSGIKSTIVSEHSKPINSTQK